LPLGPGPRAEIDTLLASIMTRGPLTTGA
jgi:hypothetical protein